MKAIECRGLCAAYDKKLLEKGIAVIRDISFDIEEGSSVAILGPNGSGKSTLLKTLCAMIPAKGTVLIREKDAAEMSRRDIARNIAYMTQLSEIFFSYTVYETVLMGRYVHSKGLFGSTTDKDRSVTEEALKSTGVEELKDRQLSSLSGGELQRVFLARTFAQGSPILMLDEPNNHLDLKVQAELAGYLKQWCTQEQHTLIGVYHDIPLALELADRFILMKDGNLKAIGSREEILNGGLLEETYGFEVRSYLGRIEKLLK